MKLLALAVALGCATLVALAGIAAATDATPSIVLQEYCPVVDGQQFYGVVASVTGLPPNTSFVGTLALDGDGLTASFVTDASGNFGPISIAKNTPIALVTAIVDYSGGQLTASLPSPCQQPPPPATPTDKAQCKKDGFAAYGFKNQGQCVSFIASRGRSAK